MTTEAWAVRRTEYVLRDRWINVRADDCLTSSGVRIAPYYVLESADFVHVFAQDTSQRIILVRQYRHGFGGMSIELPGGIMDVGEADCLATAARELQEETGFIGQKFETIATLSPDPARYANRIHLVFAKDVRPGPSNPEPSENIEVILCSRDEALHLAQSGAIMSAVHVGLLLMGLPRLQNP